MFTYRIEDGAQFEMDGSVYVVTDPAGNDILAIPSSVGWNEVRKAVGAMRYTGRRGYGDNQRGA